MFSSLRRTVSVCLLVFICLFLTVSALPRAEADGTLISRVLIQTGKTPIASQPVSEISVGTSTGGCYVASSGWFDSSGNRVYDSFGTVTVHLELQVVAQGGFSFFDGTDAYINNDPATILSNDGTTLSIRSHDYSPAIWRPDVFKSPGPETVDEGDWTSFVVSGQYVGSYEWRLERPDGSASYTLREAISSFFPYLTCSGENTDKLILSNVPADLNGWKIYCVLWSVGQISSSRTNTALITVRAAATPTPAPTPEPTPEPTPAPTPAPTPEPGGSLSFETLRLVLFAIAGVFFFVLLFILISSAVSRRRKKQRKRRR